MAAAAARLFAFERVFQAADGVLNFAFNLVSLAFQLQLGVADGLAEHLLDCTFDLLPDPTIRSLSMIFFLNSLANKVYYRGGIIVIDFNQPIFPGYLSFSGGEFEPSHYRASMQSHRGQGDAPRGSC